MKLTVIILSLVSWSTQAGLPYQQIDIEDKDFWHSIGQNELDNAIRRKFHDGVAKNVIIFIGDGMGPSTVTAARIYQGQRQNKNGETNQLVFEKFPAVGLSKTYNVDSQVPDSASTATAMFTGVKIKQSMVGLDAIAAYNVCIPEANRIAKVSSMMTWAQEKGKDTGVVTTTRVTHATPAASYAHINNRDWECDGEIPKHDRGCVKDIARQLIEDAPGNKFKVILGGGRKQFGDFNETTTDDSCDRKDSLNLTQEWLKQRKDSKYVTSAQQLSAVDTHKTNYLLGLFAPGHLSYVAENVTSRPSLKQMTTTAIKMLQKNKKGFVLLVEAGRIDLAHHKNYAKLALIETIELDEAVAAAVDMTKPSETLVIVTADHSHPMTINGYPKRGNDILGLAKNTSKVSFETLTYATGPGYAYHHIVSNDSLQTMGACVGSCSEPEKKSASSLRNIKNDPKKKTDVHYQHMSGIYLEDDNHGGEDVAIYATGPKAHLLVGVHEQNYIAHVISYASCIGPESHRCQSIHHHSSSARTAASFLISLAVLLPVILLQ